MRPEERPNYVIRTRTEVQAFSVWTPPSGTLGGLVAEARERAEALGARSGELERAARAAPPVPSFGAALRRADVAVIAEVKRRSPSKGWIKASLSAVDQARAYERGGAAAVSILTEPDHFGGSPQDLVDVGEHVTIPRLKKDFHVHPIQLVEAKALGASAALLIARALSPQELILMVDSARAIALEVLIEVRDEAELERALALDVPIVGINNRDLETLQMDATTSERLLGRIPPNVIAVAESGVSGRADIERVGASGADAVLVGSSVSAADDPVAAVAALTGVRRTARRG